MSSFIIIAIVDMSIIGDEIVSIEFQRRWYLDLVRLISVLSCICGFTWTLIMFFNIQDSVECGIIG